MADMFKGEMLFAGKIVFIPRQNGSNKENSELKQRIFKLEEDQKKMQKQANDIEQHSKRNNIRIFGKQENKYENIT